MRRRFTVKKVIHHNDIFDTPSRATFVSHATKRIVQFDTKKENTARKRLDKAGGKHAAVHILEYSLGPEFEINVIENRLQTHSQ